MFKKIRSVLSLETDSNKSDKRLNQQADPGIVECTSRLFCFIFYRFTIVRHSLKENNYDEILSLKPLIK